MKASRGAFAYSVGIPTMNRPRELRHCLGRICMQKPQPQCVLILDDGALDPAEIKRWLEGHPIELVYHRKETRGLIGSLNLAAEMCPTEWLLLLDDDIILGGDFMERMVEALEAEEFDSRVAGVAGYPVCKREGGGASARAGLRRVWFRLFLLGGGLEGRYLSSGFLTNYGEGWNPGRPWDVEHVPGGLGLWRAEVLRRYRFDAEYAGYAAGNDKDIAYRVSRRERLICHPCARALHRKSPASRIGRRRLGAMRSGHQKKFFLRHFSGNPLRWICFGWAMAGLLALMLGSALTSARRDRFEEWVGMLEGLAGLGAGRGSST